MNVLKDGRLVLSNNLAERGIKSLVMGRKNWLFSKSFEGFHAVATILSLVETAKSNGVHPRKYLDYLLTYLPNRQNTPLEAYLPWNPKLQMDCRKTFSLLYASYTSHYRGVRFLFVGTQLFIAYI